MMELNREQIVKALECCSLDNEHQEEECDKCPFDECPRTICQNILAYRALAIIRELTEENERLRIRAEEGTLATTYSAMPNIDQKARIKDMLEEQE